ncbi:Prohibitin-2, subunit of the prohibitin complex (Phb1p-Phb2p) [Mucor velutinosus]|uniref:Prohibitin-2, subunit of the prohibitin complex (Phb1p-Phb2p) n=1 Tax=Mucor velutinosus TaxID=708070 RepID=A0AAN7I0G5_9FUNG|nr:Prohibitin-2, subunit of the prohibitin complex (Phb1p-Phb2p) [Mucor velutinosus]
MKPSRYIALPLAYAVCLVMLANEAQAKAATTKVEDVTNWTKDQVQAYLDKYQIAYDKNDESLLDTVKRYRDAAVANAGIFISDKADSVTRLVEGLKIKLEKQYKLSANNVDALSNDLSHELKQLELSGSLTQDKVKQALDKYQHKAIKQKYVTAAQWKDISNDIQGSFASPNWYQRIFGGGPSHSKLFAEDSFHTWLTTSVTQRLQQNKDLTKAEIDSVVDSLNNAITTTSSSVQDLSKLGTAAWWKQFSKDLEKSAKLKQNQADAVVESLKDEVNAYKIFAIDYAGETAQQTQNYLLNAAQYLKDAGYDIYQKVVHPLQSNPEKEAKVSGALYTASSAAASATSAAGASASSLHAAATDAAAAATDAAASATDAAASSASVLRAQASESVYNAKDNFGRFWRQKELETYKKIGYTEAHINWIENYLSKTFHANTDFAKDTVQNAIRTIRQYLVNAKVQTAAHVDSQLKSIEGLIESWRRTVVRDEL